LMLILSLLILLQRPAAFFTTTSIYVNMTEWSFQTVPTSATRKSIGQSWKQNNVCCKCQSILCYLVYIPSGFYSMAAWQNLVRRASN
jgi:hypothetical protein